ncbi:M28 family peptidase [Sporosarcina sp. HYO08]|uniref:M28 family peptidase n=1 Tax=Sporosarcina sp. HYO08 TaxID=1759557 RepID=UPI00079A7ED1|nr:M28 family peptidase [Sporosarcina sp. HYO08]KXH87286.1 aminopeptidase [Sporosarcina sp. HYO08]
MKRKPFMALLLAASLTMGIPAAYAKDVPGPAPQAQQAFDNKIVKRINVDNIYNDIKHLSSEPRVAGTEAESRAAQYIESKFSSFGYETEIQPFTFESYQEPTISVTVADAAMTASNLTYTPNGEAAGELVYAGLGQASDLAGIDVTDKIVLIKRGDISFADKVLNAAEAGASAVIIFNNTTGSLNGTLGAPNDNFVPAVALSQADGEKLAAFLADGQTISATVEVAGGGILQQTSQNVVAVKKPTNKKKATNQIIVVGAHHDSVPGSPGANDDASGTATTIELARVMANMPTDTEIRFITFGAEEVGLLGSYAYVESLSQDERDRIVGMFQLDMVGSGDAGDLVMFTVDGEKNVVTDLAAAAGVRTANPLGYGQESRSDHVPFHNAGIPAALFIHSPTEPWYHTPQDSLDKISKAKLQETAEIVGAAVYQIARPDTPALERAKVAPKPVQYEKIVGGL